MPKERFLAWGQCTTIKDASYAHLDLIVGWKHDLGGGAKYCPKWQFSILSLTKYSTPQWYKNIMQINW